MACIKCDFKGYIEDIFFANDKQNIHIRRCPYCNDDEAYSKHIQKTYSPNYVSPNSENYSEYVKQNFGRKITPTTPPQITPKATISFPSSILGNLLNKQPEVGIFENVINFIDYKRKYDKRVSPLFPENHCATILAFKRK